MSDFLIRIGHDCDSGRLLALLKEPYGVRAPQGRGFDFAWGSVAVLEDRLASNANIIGVDGGVLAWVGDLVGGMSETFRAALIARLASLHRSAQGHDDFLEDDPVFRQLNGAFAILYADEMGFHIVTDPLGTTQVFLGKGADGRTVSAGTHADLVAVAGEVSEEVDPVSLGQFLRQGHCDFPCTMYKNLVEGHPGTVFAMCRENGELQSRQWLYWQPPAEVRTGYSETDLADRLREVFLAAVAERCAADRTGVALSGGLDSRLVTAAVPRDKAGIVFTLCDRVNREARTARRAAAAYGRPWFPLIRHQEYLADHLVGAVRFIGCECEFVHAHLFGFADTITNEVDVLLTGDLLDTLLRAYTAKDFVCRRRLRGLLPNRYERIPFDGLDVPRDFWDERMPQDVLESMAERRKDFCDRNADPRRGSVAEFLKIYPFRQWLEVATWAAQRRRLPIRLPGADRRLLDFAFTCPVELKLGDRIFLKVAQEVMGPGLRIPSANDGVRPCSGHLWRLAQRAIRKMADWLAGVMEGLGWKAPIQHSWHDYPMYWRESQGLARLRRTYGPNLSSLDGVLFKGSGQVLLEDEELRWEHGLRLLQLAVWLGLVKEYRGVYRRELDARTSDGSESQLSHCHSGYECPMDGCNRKSVLPVAEAGEKTSPGGAECAVCSAERVDSGKSSVRSEPLSDSTRGSSVPHTRLRPSTESTSADTQDVRTLSVAFVPYWGAKNPYQDALARHLSALGVRLEKGYSLKDLFRYGILLSTRPDIVHLHWLPEFGWREWRFLRAMAFVSRLALLRLRGVPLIWTVHNLVPHESLHPRLDWLLARTVAALSSGLIVHGQNARERVIDTWRLQDRGHFAVIPHANYIGDYPNHIDRAAARGRLGVEDSRVVFLFLGAVRPYKGVLELIQAFQQLAPDRAVLVIAGQPLNEEFRRKIEAASAGLGNVQFHPGFVPDDQIQVYMNAADVVVLPYRHLLSSGAALLAMSFGKPCIGPAMGCLTDVLDDRGAFLYDPAGETGLLESMRQAVERAEALSAMGQYNRRKASQWTWASAAAATRALYERCLSRTLSTGRKIISGRRDGR